MAWDDYTTATNLEKFVQTLEACVTTWRDKGEVLVATGNVWTLPVTTRGEHPPTVPLVAACRIGQGASSACVAAFSRWQQGAKVGSQIAAPPALPT